MFPLLPILILLFLGPANAERLAVEGRLPAGLLAVHRARIAPVRATVVAPCQEEVDGTVIRQSEAAVVDTTTLLRAPLWARSSPLQLACPPRAGPRVA